MRLRCPRQVRHGAFKCDPTRKGLDRSYFFFFYQNKATKQNKKPAQGGALKGNRAKDALVTSDSLVL